MKKTKVEIIAEIGINHDGDIELAHKYVSACYRIGVDTVKFQMVNPEKVYKKNDPLFKIFKRTQLTNDNWVALKKQVEKLGMKFLCTPGDKESVDFLDSIKVERFKIASDSAKNIKFVDYVLSKNKPVIVSMGQVSSSDRILDLIVRYNKLPHAVMHCVSKYPTKPEDAKLLTLRELKRCAIFSQGIKLGYSDHAVGYLASMIAVGIGAVIIEKHIKLQDNAVDASVSLSPKEFLQMIKNIREIEKLI